MKSMTYLRTCAASLAVLSMFACHEPTGSDDTTDYPITQSSGGTFRGDWEDGTTCAKTPAVESSKLTDSTIIFRQSICTSFEAPFIYLLLGKSKALLLDSGAGGADIEGPVDAAIEEWMNAHELTSLPLVVAHSHSHRDHVMGDKQFRERPNTTVVGLAPAEVASFFAIESWPESTATFDLGERVLDVVPIPGHEASHIAIYDHEQQLLLTGDTLYPGRLFVDDWKQYRASVKRLVAFIDDKALPVRSILGAHIEMTTEGEEYAFGAEKHPNEHRMDQPMARLRELDAAAQAMGPTARREAHPDFVISP